MKQRTLDAFAKWSETHKMSENFTWEGKPIKGSEFKKIAYGVNDTVKAVKTLDTINIDVKEEENADMGQSLDEGHSEES